MKEFIFSQHVMGTELDVVTIGDYEPIIENQNISQLFEEYENKFSRFIPDSELSLLNAKKELFVSNEFIEVLDLAKELYEYSEGLFNPLTTPFFLGYESSFEELDKKLNKSKPFGNIDFSEINIDRENRKIILKENQFLDFGGFLKGYVSDLASERLEKFSGSIVNLGGDIVCRGLDLGKIPFVFNIAHPIYNEKNIVSLELKNQSLATSSIVKRNWLSNGTKYHHIVDPRSKDSAKNSLLSVSVLHKKGVYADALATVGIVLGIDKGIQFFEEKGLQALFITNNFDIVPTSRLKDLITIL